MKGRLANRPTGRLARIGGGLSFRGVAHGAMGTSWFSIAPHAAPRHERFASPVLLWPANQLARLPVGLSSANVGAD